MKFLFSSFLAIACFLASAHAGFVTIPKAPEVPSPEIPPSRGGDDPSGGTTGDGSGISGEPRGVIGEPGAGEGDGIQISESKGGTPFQESDKSEEWKELSEKIVDILKEAVESAVGGGDGDSSSAVATTTTDSLTSMITEPPDLRGVNVELACDVYSSLSLACGALYSYGVASEVSASCLCYSSRYYVPQPFGYAASACSMGDPSFTASGLKRLCAGVGNIRNWGTATFGQFAVTFTDATTATWIDPDTTSIPASEYTSPPVEGASTVLHVQFWHLVPVVVALLGIMS